MFVWCKRAAAFASRRKRSIWRGELAAFGAPLTESGRLDLPDVPERAGHNAHIYWIKLADGDQRAALQRHLADRGIRTHIHYVPLHSAPAGGRYGRFAGTDRYTSADAARLLRLPLYYGFERVPDVVGAVAEWLAEA